jgi:flagellar hook-associated protein 2
VGLRFDPIGGGQFKQAVQQLIEAESQPIKTLEKRKVKEDARLKLFQEFKSKFTGLDKAINEAASFKKFRELKVDLGDGASLMNVTLDKEKADTGEYTLEIDELAGKTSVISNGFETPDSTLLGLGFVTFELEDGSSKEIYIDDHSSSLAGIASILNHERSSPVRAAVIRDEADLNVPWKLLLTGKKEGASNQINYPEFHFMDAAVEFVVDQDHEAKNAALMIDGFEIESETNDVVDFLPGVNIHLRQAKPDAAFTMKITEDYPKMAGKVKLLVDQINQVLQFIIQQNTVDAHSDTSTTFAGDSGLQLLEYQLRNVVHSEYIVEDEENSNQLGIFLSRIGIEFSKTLEKDFNLISQAICGKDGFARKLKLIFDGYNHAQNGMLTAKEHSIHERIKNIDNQIDEKNKLLERKKQDIVAQFSRLESTLSQMQRQQQYLSASLPGAGGSNPISQLLGGM